MNARVVALLVIVLAAAAAPRATTMVPADLGELSRDALAIVRGRVVAVDGRWTDDRRGIETIVTLDVEEYLKGDLGATVRFRLPGGLLGRFRSVVVGAPRFTVDDRVVVFLGAKSPMIPYLVGFSQGVYRVVRDPARRDVWRVMPPAPPEGPAVVVRGDPARTPLPLPIFEARVRALAETGR